MWVGILFFMLFYFFSLPNLSLKEKVFFSLKNHSFGFFFDWVPPPPALFGQNKQKKLQSFLYACPVRGPDLNCEKILFLSRSQIILIASNMSLYVQVFQLADAVTIVCIEHDVEVPENHLSLYGFKTQDSPAAKYLMHQCCGSSRNRFLECCFQGKGLSHLFSKM